MDTKHTPGPWKIVQRSRSEDGGAYPAEIVSADGNEYPVTPLEAGCIAQLALDNPGSFWDDSEVKKCNARLIAAAPELLEALVAAVDCRMVPVSSAKDGACRHSRQVEVADMIRAAIAKATGEQA